jgi:hypothetical protein
MTPEEKFKRLRDESLWHEIRLPRTTRPAARSRVWQWAVPIVAGLVVAVLLVVGVNVFRNGANLQPADPTPATTSETTDGPISAPAQLFGGDCDSVITTAQVNDIVGVDLSDDPDEVTGLLGDTEAKLTGAYGFVTRQIGGLNCSWVGTGKGAPPFVSLTFVPANIVANLDKQVNCADNNPDDSGSCSIDMVVDRVRIFGAIGQAGGEENLRIAAAVLAIVTAAAAEQDGSVGHTRAEGEWPLPVDCDALDAGADIAGDPVDHMGDGASSIVYADLLNDGNNLRCDWSSGVAEYRSGGAWAEPTIAALPDTTEIDVAGFDHVYKVKYYDAYIYHFFRGKNWLMIDQVLTNEADTLKFAVKVADGLDKL